MRSRLLIALFVAVSFAAAVPASGPAQAAPPGPQCSVRECGPPTDIVRKIIETCQYAYCQLP